MRVIFIGVNGTSTDLEKLVWHHVEAGWPSHMADRPGGAASTDPSRTASDPGRSAKELGRLACPSVSHPKILNFGM
jgi:hypothetical protein